MVCLFKKLSFLLLALVIHWPIFQLRNLFPIHAILEREPVEVSDLRSSIVFSESAESPNTDTTARFLSDRRNRVIRETRGLVGRFLPGGNASVLGELFSGGVGSTPDVLPNDIPAGTSTVLNTDRYRYASFIQRIADAIYQPWVDHVEAAREALAGGGKGDTIDVTTYITRISISLDRQGEVVGISLVKSCGNKSFDDSPKRAFWDVGSFPNPPTELFSDSETIRLQYEFHLEFRKRLFEILPFTV